MKTSKQVSNEQMLLDADVTTLYMIAYNRQGQIIPTTRATKLEQSDRENQKSSDFYPLTDRSMREQKAATVAQISQLRTSMSSSAVQIDQIQFTQELVQTYNLDQLTQIKSDILKTLKEFRRNKVSTQENQGKLMYKFKQLKAINQASN